MDLPITLGAGYDSFTAKAFPSVLLPTRQTGWSGMVGSAVLEVCTSYAALCRGLGTTLGYCVASDFAGISNWPASLAMTPTSVCVLIKSVQSVSTSFLVAPFLGLGASPPDAKPQARQFFRQFGDSYVSSVSRGSMYVAAYVIDGQTPAGQTALTKRLSGMNGLLQSSTAASLAGVIDACPTSVRFAQSMLGATGMALPNSNDIQAVLAFAQGFATAAKQGNKALLSFSTTGYEHLGAFHDLATQHAFAPIVANRHRFYHEIVPTAIALLELQNQARAIEAVYTRYGGFDDALLTSRAQSFTEAMALLQSWVKDVERDPTSSTETMANLAPIETIATWGLPTLNYSISTPVTWGGGGGVAGTSFTDIATTNAGTSALPMTQFPVLTSLNANGTQWLNAIQCSYAADSLAGSETFSHGTPVSTAWGTALQLAAGEFVTSISGSAGWYVNQLQVATSKNQQWSYPSSPQSATSFAWTVPEGFTLVGFQGVAGAYVNALSPIVIRFQPASWVRLPNPISIRAPVMPPTPPLSETENASANAAMMEELNSPYLFGDIE